MGTFTLSPPAPARSFLGVLVCGYSERRRAGSDYFPTCNSSWKIELKDECLHKIRRGILVFYFLLGHKRLNSWD